MKAILAASVGVLALAGALAPAAAADLPRQMPTKAPAYVAPYYNWTGLYIGINGGGAFGDSSWSGMPTGDFDVSGGLVGGTIGYNWQFGQFVAGLEGDVDWTNINGSTLANCGAIACETRNDWLGTIRGRIGYAFDRVLPYVTGGVAFGNIKADRAGFAGVDENNAGWTVGGGLEFAVMSNLSLKAEYLYVDLGSVGCDAACGAPAGNNVDLRTNIVRGGLNYRF
jgi:outer membrane immunogenic protein